MTSRGLTYLTLLFFLVLAWADRTVCQTPPELAKLQNDFAMRYLEPEPHMALAKYYLAQGNRREAFFILETARRGIIEEKVFDHAFQVEFEGFDNSTASEQKLLSQLAQNPHSADIQFKLADIYISRTDYAKANELLLAALKEHPEDYRFTAGLAGVLSAQGKSQEASRIIDRYTKNYPESEEGFLLRVDALHKTNPRSEKPLLEQAIAKYPNSGELVFRLAAVLQTTGQLNQAEAAFVKAAALAPKSVLIQSWVGRFFFKVRNDGERALPYYLNAYFLSPHAYETEFVESRIRNVFLAQAQSSFQTQLRAKRTLLDLLADPNPGVISMTLKQMDKEWKPTYLEAVVGLMAHEDDAVRWDATQLLKTKVDSSFDARLKTLLKDPDLRKRGLAAYIAVYRWQTAAFEWMDELLSDDAQLLRFDALSALILEGGEAGKRRALAHAAKETNPTLLKLLEAARKN